MTPPYTVNPMTSVRAATCATFAALAVFFDASRKYG
jgi:hypothetical protein